MATPGATYVDLTDGREYVADKSGNWQSVELGADFAEAYPTASHVLKGHLQWVYLAGASLPARPYPRVVEWSGCWWGDFQAGPVPLACNVEIRTYIDGKEAVVGNASVKAGRPDGRAGGADHTSHVTVPAGKAVGVRLYGSLERGGGDCKIYANKNYSFLHAVAYPAR